MDIQKATEEKLERKMQMGVPIDETILEGLIQKMSFQFLFQMML
ncbi:hypothetical protein [Paenibacillus sp. 1781tsa1]|nr:hypothetical protein [Paenibacillus sp. 1781tsa1]